MKHVAVVAILLGVGCMVGNDAKQAGARFSERCEGAGSAYGQCVDEVGKDRDTCYAGCAEGVKTCAKEALLGFTGLLGCAGPLISTVIGCETCNGKTGDDFLACEVTCAVNQWDTMSRDPQFFAKLETCFATHADAAAFSANFPTVFAGVVAAGAGCALQYGVCTSADTVGPFELGSCDTLYTAGVDACETAQCNPGFCTCFDAQECPTISGGAAATHMTGVVACDSISFGKATTAQGTEVSCISYANNAETDKCVETGYNPDGSYGGRGKGEACGNDGHCGDDADGVGLFCMDYDCDEHPHCDYMGMGGTGNCCETTGPRDVGCKDGFICESEDGESPRTCVVGER